MQNAIVIALYKQPQTVFTMKDISLLFPDISYQNLKKRMSDFAKSGAIKKLRRGIYAKDKFNPLELANKLYAPSYISLETVLAKGAVTFQYYQTIFAASYLTREIKIGDANIQYRRIKANVLTNPAGIRRQSGYFIASVERAFLDAVYIYKNYHFDNLGAIDWEKARELKKIYKSKVLEKRLDEYYHIYQEEL